MKHNLRIVLHTWSKMCTLNETRNLRKGYLARESRNFSVRTKPSYDMAVEKEIESSTFHNLIYISNFSSFSHNTTVVSHYILVILNFTTP